MFPNSWRIDLFVKMMQADSPSRCCIQENFPLISNVGHLSGRLLAAASKQIALALTALHKMGYQHCDVRPGTFLWDANGFALIRSESEGHIPDRFPYSSGYRAPELWGPACDKAVASRATEAWALGVTIAELMLNENLFEVVGE